MRLLVLGGGAQGRVIAGDLAAALPTDAITVADVREPRLLRLPNLHWMSADLSDPTATARLMRDHDLLIGALPSQLGFSVMRAAIDAGRDLVDVSFCAENPLSLDAEARRRGVAILPDCGLAPGLSHLSVGYVAEQLGMPDEVMIYVGGVAQDPSRPYGYVVTWSLADLEQEYLRPANVVLEGRRQAVPVFSGLETLDIPAVGSMEAFYSDGLRTLIDTLPGIPTMGEKTLRWPGHVAAVEPLVRSGRFIEEFQMYCVVPEPRDLVVLLVTVRRGDRELRMLLVDRYHEGSRMTAMSRTTALTTSAVAQVLATGLRQPPGVRPLELVARDPRAYEAIRSRIQAQGITLRWSDTSVPARAEH